MKPHQKESEPIICFGQQPCGFFPKRFLISKIMTARRLQQEIGGRVVFFYHDSDHDYRETSTILTHKQTGQKQSFNFTYSTKIHKKYTPLYCKRFKDDWKKSISRQLPNYINEELLNIFKNIKTQNTSLFCLEMYRALGWLKQIEIVRSSDPQIRNRGSHIDDFFVDVQWQDEWVRAKMKDNKICLHKGGGTYQIIPKQSFEKWQISPTRDSRLKWMQSIINCTHYIAGEGELAYLDQSETPEIKFIKRDAISDSHEACTEIYEKN